ncbi:MAG: type IV pilus assembly protein PilM [Candidatus Omnitrophica bacterium]|nr:type IV pilus assembly protein PilM [Candidatus Omnitrophota bacterium]
MNIADILKLKDVFQADKLSVGLNLGVSTLKMAKLKFSADGAKVQLCAYGLEENNIGPEDALKKVCQSCGVKVVNISVSGQQAIIRYVDFPKMNAAELKQALKFEAQKHIPFPLADVNIDGYILQDSLPENKMRVLLAAVKKDFLNQRLKLLKDAGFDIAIADIDSLALVNAFNFNYSDDGAVAGKTIALLNIGSVTCNLNILEAGMPSLSRDINIGGNNFTQKIADTLSVSFKEAEGMKTAKDSAQADKILSIGEPVLAKLAQEVRTSFDYYESRSVTSVEKIYLSGGGSLYPGLREMLSNLLAISVENWDPLRKIELADDLEADKVRPLAGQLAVAIGLALRR